MNDFRRYFLATCVVVFFCLPLASQNWYQNFAEEGNIEDMAELPNGEWLAMSHEQDERVFLLRLDRDGNTIGKKHIYSGSSYGGRLVNAGNKFWYYITTSTVRVNGQNVRRPIFVLDEEGEILNVTTFPEDYNFLFDVIGNADGTASMLYQIWQGKIMKVARVINDGTVQWRKEWGPVFVTSTIVSAPFFKGAGLLELPNGNTALYGYDHDAVGPGDGDVYYSQFGKDGELIVHSVDSTERILRSPTEHFLNKSFVDHDGNIIIVIGRFRQPYTVEFLRISPEGKLLNSHVFDTPRSRPLFGVQLLSNDEYLLLYNISLVKLNADFEIIWEKELPELVSGNRRSPTLILHGVRPWLAGGGFMICGEHQNGSPDLSFAAQIDSGSVLQYSRIRGLCYQDDNGNCLFDQGEKLIKDLVVAARPSLGVASYDVSDRKGEYGIDIPVGDYDVYPNLRSPYQKSCPDTQQIRINDLGLEVSQNFGLTTIVECPYLNVHVSNSRLRQCIENKYTIDFWNSGTASASDAHIEVELDPFLELRDASRPFTFIDKNTVSFDIGDIAIGERGSIRMKLFLDCDSTIRGQTHCVEAHIFPDSICIPPSLQWDGSSVTVEAQCEGDSVRFKVQNIGDDMLDSKQYIIVEDDIILMVKTFRLNKNGSQEVAVEATGKTLRIIAEQSDHHPGFSHPTAAVELCDDQSGSLGFINDFPLDDENPFVDVLCVESTNSFDPNDKSAMPSGFQAENYIDQGRTINYHIRFQNTGNDTAYIVILRDSIDENLDLGTLTVNSSSHDYQVDVKNGSMLVFTFDDIYLPDSTTDIEASQGYVNYSIRPKKDIAMGQVILNDADIYFDFNKPIRTNEVYHTIGLEEVLTSVIRETKQLFELNVYPNPAYMSDVITVKGIHERIKQARVEIYSNHGVLMESQPLKEGEFLMKKTRYPSGLYNLVVKDESNRIMAVHKLIIR